MQFMAKVISNSKYTQCKLEKNTAPIEAMTDRSSPIHNPDDLDI